MSERFIRLTSEMLKAGLPEFGLGRWYSPGRTWGEGMELILILQRWRQLVSALTTRLLLVLVTVVGSRTFVKSTCLVWGDQGRLPLESSF